MIRHVWSVLCQSGAIDIEDNQLSMFDVLTTLKVFGDPEKIRRFPLRFEIFSLWTRAETQTGSKGKMRLVYVKPNGDPKPQFELPIDLVDHLFRQTRMRVMGLELNGSGVYNFVIEKQVENEAAWDQVAVIPLLVEFEPQDKLKIKTDPLQ